MPFTERAKRISVFVTPEGAYQYCVMPFGMKNSQATFVGLMNTYLENHSGVDTYIDDMMINSDNCEEHVLNRP